MAIRIPIISDFDSKGLDKAVRQFEQLKTTGEKAQFGLERAAKPAGVALLGLAAAAGFATNAAIQDAAAQDQLAGVLQRQTGATKEQVAETEAFISSLSRATAMADDELRPALAQLVNATGNLQTSQHLLTRAQDLAVATNSDLATAVDAVAKAYNGQTRGLAKLDPSLRDAIASGASFDEIMQKVAQTTGGAAAEAANTTAGRFKTLSIQFGELQETLGAKLLPVAESLVGVLINVVDIVAKNAGVVVGLAAVLGTLAGIIYATKVAYAAYNAIALITKGINFALATSFTAVQIATGIGIITVAAGAAALATYVIQMKRLNNELPQATAAQAANNGIIRAGGKAYIEINGRCVELNASLSRNINLLDTQNRRLEGLARSFGITTFETGRFNEKVGGGGGATEKVIEFGKQVKDGLTVALETAKANLQSAQDAFIAFKDTVKLGVLAALSFGDAYKLIDDNGKTFMQNLKEQVDGIKKYAANLQILLQRGLSQEALKYVLEAGGEAGAAIAAELVAGTTDLITGPGGINEMVAAANAAADAVGMQAAGKWYQAGIDQATQIVAGLDAQLAALTPALMARMDKIAAKLGRTVDITVRVKEVVTRISGGAPITAPKDLINPSTMAATGFAGASLPPPSNSTVNVNVNGGLATSAEIGQAVVNSIRAYTRSAGPAQLDIAPL
jgi:hypothetical protein